VSGMYLLTVQMAVCLESSDKCESIATVLNNTLITKMPCDLDPGFVIQSNILKFSILSVAIVYVDIFEKKITSFSN
jgi:hypothetical protein